MIKLPFESYEQRSGFSFAIVRWSEIPLPWSMIVIPAWNFPVPISSWKKMISGKVHVVSMANGSLVQTHTQTPFLDSTRSCPSVRPELFSNDENRGL